MLLIVKDQIKIHQGPPPSLLKEMMWGHRTAQIHSGATGPSDTGDGGWLHCHQGNGTGPRPSLHGWMARSLRETDPETAVTQGPGSGVAG